MKQKVFNILNKLKLKYSNYEHKPVFSCSDAKGIKTPGKRVKSLLLRNKKATKYYMIIIEDYKTLDSKKLRYILGENKLSFASPERMLNTIGVTPGNVSPFACVNNKEKNVLIVFDEELKNEIIGFHPCQNDNTVVLNNSYVEKYLDYLQIEYKYLKL